MTMRFGGHIAAAACFVYFTGAVAAQTASPASEQTPLAQQATPAQNQAQPDQQNQAQQSEAGQTNAQTDQPSGSQQPQNGGQAQQQKQPSKPGDKKNKVTTSDVDEFEQKIRNYDPRANDNQQPQTGGNVGASGNSTAKKPRESDSTAPPLAVEPGGVALPGPAVDGADAGGDMSAYSGPAVLSRGYTLLRPLIPSQQRWTPLIGVNGIFDSGLNGFQPYQNGPQLTGGSYGAEVFWGLQGRRYFHRDVVGVDYRGDMQYYSPAKAFDGSNHWLSIDYSHLFSRHLSMTLVESGVVYSQNYALGNPVAVSNASVASLNLGGAPDTQIFDNGFQQFTTSADMTWQKSARLSFNIGGSWFGVRRNVNYLLGVTGEQGRADAMYRVTRRTTVGVSYGYNTYSFPRGFGGAEFHTFDGIYSWAMSSTLQLLARGGASRLYSYGLTTIYLPAPISTLLGQNNVLAQYQSKQWVSDYSLALVKNFRRSRSGSLSYARGITPGNGLYLTSVDQTFTASGSMVFMRRYYASFGGGYDSLSAAAQVIGAYRSYFAFAGISRELRRGLQSNIRFDYRHYIITDQPLLQNEFRVTIGFSWTPSEGLLRLW